MLSKYIYTGSQYKYKTLMFVQHIFLVKTVLNGTIYLCNKDLCIRYDLWVLKFVSIEKTTRVEVETFFTMHRTTTKIGIVYTGNLFFKYVGRRFHIRRCKSPIDKKQKSLCVEEINFFWIVRNVLQDERRIH